MCGGLFGIFFNINSYILELRCFNFLYGECRFKKKVDYIDLEIIFSGRVKDFGYTFRFCFLILGKGGRYF